MRVPALASTTTAWTSTTRAPAPWACTPRSAAATAATRPRSLGVGNLDRDTPAVELTAVQLGDRVVRPLRGIHLDEAEATRLAREPVGDDGRRKDVAALAEELSQAIAGGGVRKAADIDRKSTRLNSSHSQ